MFFKRDVLLAQEYLGFTLLNLFDLFLTGWIFRNHGMEANSLAVWFLKHGGLRGFVIYKFCLVIVVVLACEGISLKSVQKSRALITAGCLVYVFIVFYESFLIFTHVTNPSKESLSFRPAAISQVSPAHNFGCHYVLLPASERGIARGLRTYAT